MYIFVKRSVLMPMMEGFDAPTATQTCERRMTTVVPTQSLQLMNSAFTNEQAAYLAKRLSKEAGADPGKQVERLYWLTLSRPPTTQQRESAIAFLNEQRQLHRRKMAADDEAMQAALTDLCHVMLNLNEFVYVN